ncbi:MAG: AmmeMemoRadiSam system protein B [Candidatus Rokubacteria bacterium]|nr:AmmeMemoRadiSam system protein B [Candidatus Rokubacteria bacterium]
MAHPFALTGKDYESPLGPVAVDRAFVESLAARARQDCFGAELAHRVEHSIEFQAVFLRYLFDGRRDIAIVPVLASFAHEALARGRRPEDDPRVPRFLDALAETIAASGRRVALVAGADLAHVGPRFGDPEPVTPLELARIADEDRAMLAAVEAGDPAAFFESVAGDGDRRRICGLSPIWMLLAALGGGRGELKRYAQWPDPQGVVTFASVIYAIAMGTPESDWTLPALRIDADGDWFDGLVAVTHPGVLDNLRSGLRRDAAGYFIQTRVRIPVEVADAPFVVTRIERRGDRLHAHLNDGAEEDVDAATLRIGPGEVPYCAVKAGAFEARLSRAAAFQLLGLAEYDAATGRGTLRLGGRAIPLRRPA